ncbi:MAG: hypothetical protein IT373_16410 [Polyangiaceae bacterium]|nr:hypothetical protein [Polyangiaceae bacterium]
MIALIIFGSKAVTSCVTTGEFDCPYCHGRQPFKHMRVRKFFTLYWIPLIPLGVLTEYLQCQSCFGKYKPSLLGAGKP